MAEDQIIPNLTQSERDRSPMHLSGLHHPNGPDFIMDDVRTRFLQFARAKALGSKDLMVDAQVVLLPTPAGLQAQTMLMLSISSPVFGDRLVASGAVDKIQPKDDVLQQLAEDLYNAAMDHRQALLNERKQANASGLVLPGQ